MTMNSLLVEIFVEELPPKALNKLGEAFASVLANSLKAQGLAPADAVVTPFASPRRLGVHITQVLAKAADKAQQVKLMPVAVALDAAGQPTPALLKKLASLGADANAVPQLKRAPDGKAEALFFDSLASGATLADGLQKALAEAIAKLPVPKLMQYKLADGWTSVNFVRPAHGLVALHGDQVVTVSALGLHSGRVTHGHRFEAAAADITLRSADSYAEQLRSEGAVIASFAERRAELVRQLEAAAAKEGLTPIEDEALLDEVTALVEQPNVLLCRFEPEFLAVPQECLILTMKANQKYFPLLDAVGKLTEKFLIVSNIRPADPSRVIEGNERVVRPRLADAKFFFDQDRKKTLASRVPQLSRVVYHGKLGSQGDRVERVRAIAKAIAVQLGNATLQADVDRAALLAKADLLTDMVGEFPELQGVMGGYYARHDGETEAVALAIEDHYKPRFAGDALPRGEVGLVVALADKLLTLGDLFSIGQGPTGDKDPFALRRNALGVLRLLIERQMPLRTAPLIALAAERGNTDIELFLRDRMMVMCRDQGFSSAEVSAVLDEGVPAEIWSVPQRLAAVRSFAALPESASLAAANKRVNNILRKSSEASPADVTPALFTEPAEHALYLALNSVGREAFVEFHAGRYEQSLQLLAQLKEPVDAFFEHVMVMDENPQLRQNRLALLRDVQKLLGGVADLSRLPG